MATHSHLLAEGAGWRVSDFVCTAGPRDRPFEEEHGAVCIAAVTRGTFEYRSTQGKAVLTPGALLLGNHRQCFECGHEHGVGDRCLAFHFAPGFFETIVAGIPGVRRPSFAAPRLPPLEALTPILAGAEAARDQGDGGALEELAVRLAGASVLVLHDLGPRPPAQRAGDARRIADAARRIECAAGENLSLADLAAGARMSPFHFLRTFRAVIGITPHQYVLRTRLHRAAVRLRTTRDAISAIAFDAGFNDLSTFNRRFRRVMGASPTQFRDHG